MIRLPVDDVLSELVAALRRAPCAVLEAPPGAGKTTRVPGALLLANINQNKEIVVLQPRRLATRLAAARVAEERQEKLGQTVGYNIRFEDVSSSQTKIRFITEGLLTRRLMREPTLPGVGVVVLDEFHERHVAADLGLAMLRQLQLTTRPDLKLVVMSATLDAEPIAAWLGNAPRLRSEGKRFQVAIEHLESPDERPLEQQVLAALKKLIQRDLDGHVLVFLPGQSEMKRAHEACFEFCERHELALHLLHGELASQDQDRALKASDKRKVILSTNVAETSVTIEGVAAVIDAGLSRVASHSPFTGMPQLKLQKVSKASAIQRAGRAGRTREGLCLRLYTKGDFEGRPATDAPEIRRLDFTESALSLRTLGVKDVRAFSFFEAPNPSAVDSAENLLRLLGAIDARGALTDIGERMVKWPLHPRLARLVVEAENLGIPRDGAAMAALISERDVRSETRGFSKVQHASQSGPSDVLELVERYEQAKRSSARAANLDAASFSTVERVTQQLTKQLDDTRARAPKTNAERDAAMLRAVLAGFVDRVAKRRKPQLPHVVFAAGGSAELDATSVVRDAELLVAVDAEERRGGLFVKSASHIEAEWLLELPGDNLTESDVYEWNTDAKRVERVTKLSFGQISLEETKGPAMPNESVAKVLAAEALRAPRNLFVDLDALTALLARVELLREAFPEANFPLADESWVTQHLVALCEQCRSFSELKEASLLQALQNSLTPQQSRLLATETPAKLTLPGGRVLDIHYEPHKPPWIESRLQDFFGMVQGPKIGRTPLVIHLLAPNYNAVQVTTDLAGFWDRHYPAVKKEMMRHYPRHSWPDDPRTALPIQHKPRR
jgi:ATP-dependent helicase HrpB